jgi:tetratricopeptide (TPR) repeat protein
LLILRGDAVERQIELTNRDLRVGRGKENDVVLDDPEKTASRAHAELRYENGSYVVIDLNSQNGTWVEGQRVQRATLRPGVPVIMGLFTLLLEEAPAAAVHDTLAEAPMAPPPAPAATPRPAPAARPSGTVVRSAGAVAPAPGAGAGSAPARPAKARIPPKPGQAPVQPGLIATIARLPKPIIFAGFAVIVIIVMVMGQLLAPPDPNAPAASNASEPVQAPPPGRRNEDIITEHLAAAGELLERDPEAAIRDHIDRILLIDRNHPQALDLKTRAEEAVQRARLEAAVPASTIPAPASTISGAASTAPPARPGATAVPPAASAPAGRRTAPAARTGRAAGARGVSDPTMVARRPKETEAAWRARAEAVRTQYQNARRALDDGDFAAAISGFEAIMRDEPGYLDSQALLAKARDGQEAAVRQAAREAAREAARQALEAARAADAAGNWAGAVQQFERARQLDDSFAQEVDDGIRRTREKMRVAGNEAFKRARQYDALGRTADAIAQYSDAAALLPPDDPNVKVATERLTVLRGGR